ncbi:hypothetical protein PAPHI01_0074 [Pancytospora philotis]|nr:hypothetical protein PAPHI01_0074 [Pancytospora philotis]
MASSDSEGTTGSYQSLGHGEHHLADTHSEDGAEGAQAAPGRQHADAEPSGREVAQPHGHDGPDTIADCLQNRYTKKEVLRLILAYKKDSRNFFWGDLQRCCNRRNRRFDDQWYNWTREMMEGIGQHELSMRNILAAHSHSKVQSICKEEGGSAWNLKVEDKVKALTRSIRRLRRKVESPRGLSTCWGRMKLDGVFKNRAGRRSAPDGAPDYSNYISARAALWEKYYRGLSEKDDIFRMYDKN